MASWVELMIADWQFFCETISDFSTTAAIVVQI
jgi:hypothetical protein